MYIEKTNFLNKIEEILSNLSKETGPLHMMLIMNFLKYNSNEFSLGTHSSDFLRQELQCFYDHFTETKEMKEFVDNQFAMSTIVFR